MKTGDKQAPANSEHPQSYTITPMQTPSIQKHFESIYLNNYYSDLKSVFSAQLPNERRKVKAEKQIFKTFGKNWVFLEFLKTSILSFRYPGFQKKI